MPASITFPPPRDYRMLRRKRFLAHSNSSSSNSNNNNSADVDGISEMCSTEESASSHHRASPMPATTGEEEDDDECAFDGKAAGGSSESVNSEVWEDLVLALLPEDYLQALTVCAVRQQVEDLEEEVDERNNIMHDDDKESIQ